tara:strand:- start:2075 stop:2317 length:243 start_codon:yes stop_codon:yes gene_type:complete
MTGGRTLMKGAGNLAGHASGWCGRKAAMRCSRVNGCIADIFAFAVAAPIAAIVQPTSTSQFAESATMVVFVTGRSSDRTI